MPKTRSFARRRPKTRDPIQTRRTRCRRKFLRYYPGGFDDEDYVALERGYKESAHDRWTAELGRVEHSRLIEAGRFAEVADRVA